MNSIDTIKKHYNQIYHKVDKVCHKYSNILLIEGRSGEGKSRSIRDRLEYNKLLHGIEYVEFSGVLTEAYLYRILCEHNGKVIWLHDIASNLLGGKTALQILKAATETENTRRVTKNSYSKEQADLPPEVLVESTFILDYNYAPEDLRADLEALISRGDYVAFALSPTDIREVMLALADTPEKVLVTNYILEHYKNSGLVRLNLRTQWKAFNTYDYAKEHGLDWKAEIESELLHVSTIRALLYGLIGNEVVSKSELSKRLMIQKYADSKRHCERLIEKYIICEELFEHGLKVRDCNISINPEDKQ